MQFKNKHVKYNPRTDIDSINEESFARFRVQAEKLNTKYTLFIMNKVIL